MKRALTLFFALLLTIGSVAAKSDDKSTRFDTERIDREINKLPYISQGEVIVGFTASHSELSSDNAEMLLLLTNIDASGSITSVKPYIGYFYRDNRAVGVRLSYQSYAGRIDSATVDLGDTNDLEFDLPYINLSSDSYRYSIFHRSYTSIDRAGHFGLFAEVELGATYGETLFDYEINGVMKSSNSKSQSYDLSFNPGISAFILHNLSASLSFQFGGINYTSIDQYDDTGAKVGSRDSSKMLFRFNLLAINLGLTLHIF